MKRVSPLRLLAFTLVALPAIAGLWAFAATAAPGKGDPAAGKKIYATKCVACHKADGSGGIKLTGNPAPSWKDKKRMATVTDAQLRDCIVNGKVKSGMVAWGKTGQLKPAEIDHLIAYIRVLAK